MAWRLRLITLPGSSPRARGTRRALYMPPLPRNSVHPRGRGEHSMLTVICAGWRGSSPRARGTRQGNEDGHDSIAVHPRGRGEHMEGPSVDDLMDGSSPRARGTPVVVFDGLPDSRFIPAGAGNTRRAPGTARYSPPPGGEAFPPYPFRRFIPAGAGEHPFRVSTSYDFPRFIPAGAGNTAAPGRRALCSSGSSPRARGAQPASGDAPLSPVHPRGRGEHYSQSSSSGVACGSSPRARGTPIIQAGEPAVDRFIPARGEHWILAPRRASRNRFIPAGAGNTPTGSRAAPGYSVHPRGRGEHRPGPETSR